MAGGATVEVLNQTSNSEVVGAAKTEKPESEQLVDSPVATGVETTGDVAKEHDEIVKSKPLSLIREDFPDRQTDSLVKQTYSTPTGQDTSPKGKTPSTAQPSGSTSADKVATTDGDIKPKPESTPGQEIHNHKIRTSPTVLVDAGESARHVAAESATTGSAEFEVASRPHPQVSEAPTTQVSTRDHQEVTAAKSELATTAKEGPAILPSAPALIDFSTEEQQMLGVQAVDVVPATADATSESAEVIQESSRILYPRLDSIMRGTYLNLYI